MLMLSMMIMSVVPAYAMETKTNFTHQKSTISESTAKATSMYLGYGEAKNLASNITIKNRTYTYVGSVVLPNDNRIHRIIYKADFIKGSGDTGGGDVSLDVKLVRNGVNIHTASYDYMENFGYTRQIEVTGLSKNQVIDVYLDASSVNPSESNGSIRQIYLYYIQFYTD